MTPLPPHMKVLFFFEAFAQFHTSLALKILELERPYLTTERQIHDSVLDAYAAGLLQKLGDVDREEDSISVEDKKETVSDEAVEDLLDLIRGEEDGRISYRTYLGNRDCLPRMYRKYLSMLDSLVYLEALKPNSQTKPKPDPAPVTLWPRVAGAFRAQLLQPASIRFADHHG